MKMLETEDIQDKKAAALQATLELLSERGLEATPMSQIAQRANIGVGTIYRYFDDKEDLINALYVQVKNRVNHYVLQDYSDVQAVKDGFLRCLKNYFDYYLANPAELLFLGQYENSPLLTAATREENSRLSEPAYRIIRRAREEGLIKDLPDEIIGALFSGALSAMAKMCLSSGRECSDTELNAALEAIWDMLKR
jgi:AcrR family transcriptional regulator